MPGNELYNRNFVYHGTAYKDLETTVQDEGKHRADFDVEFELHGDKRHWPFKSESIQSLPAAHTGFVDSTKTWAENEANHLLATYDPQFPEEKTTGDLGASGLQTSVPRPMNEPGRDFAGRLRPSTAGELVPSHYDPEPEARAWRKGTPGLSATRPQTFTKAGEHGLTQYPDGNVRRPKTADAVVFCAADSYDLRTEDIRGELVLSSTVTLCKPTRRCCC